MARRGNAASAAVRRAASAKRNEDLLPVIEDIRGASLSTPQQIADGLNERGITAARGGAWSAVQVRRILEVSAGQKADAQRVTDDSHTQPLQTPMVNLSVVPLRINRPTIAPRCPTRNRRASVMKPPNERAILASLAPELPSMLLNGCGGRI
jgi:hypothetical protein